MGNIWKKCLSIKKGPKDEKSSWRIFGYSLEVLLEFIGGFATGVVLFTLLTMFVGVAPDPTLTVVQSNDRWLTFLLPLLFAFGTHYALRGTFGYSLDDVFFNTWITLTAATIAICDGRFNKSWGKLIMPFLMVGSNLAGLVAAAAWYKQTFGVAALSSFLVATTANTVSASLPWAYLTSSIVYTLLLLIVVLSCNGSDYYYGSIVGETIAIWLLGFVLFVCNRQLPSFAFNVAYSYISGTYDILWVDVAGGFTGLVLVGTMYFFLFNVYYEPDQRLQHRNPHLAFTSAIRPANRSTGKYDAKSEKVVEPEIPF